jgi:hypothetical protein
MENCYYDCKPTKDFKEGELNLDTYNENFIMLNTEKIFQKIRMLMREKYFYTKNDFIKRINMPKNYPFVQIYSALTQLIEDENEFIVDKYGRNGRLINIGDYYLFQPIELKDKNISIFERSNPIDYKHSFINLKVNENLPKLITTKREIGPSVFNVNYNFGWGTCNNQTLCFKPDQQSPTFIEFLTDFENIGGTFNLDLKTYLSSNTGIYNESLCKFF